MKKGFTLIEVLAVVALLGVIALIAYPAVDKAIKDAREKSYNESINHIIDTAYLYSSSTDIGYSTSYQALPIETLKNAGLLRNEDLKNPINDDVISGCVMYRWVTAKKQYEFKYSADCTDPE